MNTPAVDIKDMLGGDSSLALTFSEDLFVAEEPMSPDNCVTVYDTPGGEAQVTLNKSHKLMLPSIQVRVRNNDYRNGWDQIHDIRTFLDARVGETQNGTYYSLIKAKSEPELLSRDENGRFIFVINFEIHRR